MRLSFSALRAGLRGACGYLFLGAGCAAAGFLLGSALAAPLALAAASAAPSALPTPSIPSAPSAPPAVSSAPSAPADSAPQRVVCLTFDDGPSRNTPAVLEALADAGVPATFFVVASDANASHLPLVAEARAAGHQIALHSASHRYSDIYRSAEAFWDDIDLLRDRLAPWLEDAASLRWLRFPGGSTNTVSHKYGGDGIMDRLKADAEAQGLHWVDWNVSAEDVTGRDLSPADICRNVTEGSAGRDRCIVLMHDSATAAATAEALPDIIGWYKENGYAFRTVSQLYEGAGG